MEQTSVPGIQPGVCRVALLLPDPTLTGSEVPTLQAQVHFSGIVPKAVGASRWPRVGGFPASVGECLALVLPVWSHLL